MTASAVTMWAMPDEGDPSVSAEGTDPAASPPSPSLVVANAEETVEGVPVLADVRPLEPAPRVSFPAVQAAAAAATGFIAGAATVALVRRRAARRLLLAQRSNPRRVADMLPISKSRTFIVDVHLLAKPGE